MKSFIFKVVGIVVLIAVICVGCVAVKGGCATSKPVEKKVLPASTQEKGGEEKGRNRGLFFR